MRARPSPAAGAIETPSESFQPRRRRYRQASRAPLPDSSASEPSGLKMRRRATKPRSPARPRRREPAAPLRGGGGDEAPPAGRAEQEDAVGADAGVGCAERPDALGVEPARDGRLLEDHV